MMGNIDRAVVERSWGLFEYNAITSKSKEAERARYGPDFTYEEFWVMPTKVQAYMLSFGLVFSVMCLMIPPVSTPPL